MNAIDYAVVAAYLVAITIFGSYFAKFQKNTKNYFLTDNSIPWWAICFTIVATETSTLTFIGVPASAYAGNWTFLQLAAGYVIGRIIVSIVFLPRYFAGALIVFFALLNQIPGGFGEVIRVGAAAGKFTVLNLSFDPKTIYTLWAGVAGGVALTLATHGTDQFLVQRLLSADSPKSASTGLVLSGFIVFAQFMLFLMIGAMLFAYHQHFPLTVALPRNDAILPRFIVDHLPHGLIGFIVAAIVAAALSPSINAMAATTVNDFYLKRVRTPPDEATLLRLSKRITIFWGIVQLFVALGAQWLDQSVLDAGLSVLSLTTGPVLGAFLVGVLTKRVSAAAMIGGMAVGAVVLFSAWWTGAVAWTWYALLGSSVSGLSALALSLVMPAQPLAPAPAAR